MTRNYRPRQVGIAALAVLVPALFAACSGSYPNSTFTSLTEFNRDLTSLWDTMMWWGTLVFIVVEAILIYTIWRYRHRPGGPAPKHVHGNAALELTWTVAPAIILVFIAIPTVRNIWKYQTGAPADAVQIDVIGHQWWWEFRYPQYNITTANEIYLPTNRAVSFSIRTADVIHSFWIPQLGGKRDATWQRRSNHLWFTPDSTGVMAFNGSCNEFCGVSHANMRFRAFTVDPADFDRWVAHQQTPAAFPPAAAVSGTATGGGAMAAVVAAQAPAPPALVDAYSFPREQVPAHVMPRTPVPSALTFDDAALAAGDAQRGFVLYSRSACIGCHRIRGNQMSLGVIGPDLTHIGSRLTIAAGIYPNDPPHMARWLKNARVMKPGVAMNALGLNEYDPILKTRITAGGLTDEQIADIVAYLMSLK